MRLKKPDRQKWDLFDSADGVNFYSQGVNIAFIYLAIPVLVIKSLQGEVVKILRRCIKHFMIPLVMHKPAVALKTLYLFTSILSHENVSDHLHGTEHYGFSILRQR